MLLPTENSGVSRLAVVSYPDKPGGVENTISRSALSGSLEQFPMASMAAGVGSATETFPYPQAPGAMRRPSPSTRSRRISKAPAQAMSSARKAYRPRFWAHIGMLGVTALLIGSSSPAQVHGLSVRLMSAQVGTVVPLDDAATAQVAAAIADTSHLAFAKEATKVATVKSQQVSLLTTDATALSKPQVVATSGATSRNVTQYQVQAGDTLTGVASKFNVTTSTIKWANNLSGDDSIAPGQSLTILPVSGIMYTVAASDTADTLASKYQANAAQIVSYNNAELKGFEPGEKIIIPDGVKPEAPKPVASVIAAKPAGGQVAGAATASAATTSGVPPTLTRFAGGSNGYAAGYCTYYVASRRSIPSNWGNANQWYYNAQASGFSVGSTPVPGAIAWTGAGYYGHVAYVESVSGNMVTVSEMNFNGGWNIVSSRTAPASSFRYIY